MSASQNWFREGARVAVIGASGGIGAGFVELLKANPAIETVYACSRAADSLAGPKVVHQRLDLENEDSIAAAAAAIGEPLDLIVVATGMLSDDKHLPEKAMRDFDLAAMQRCFTVNAFGPALIAKHFLPLTPRAGRSVFAALSARVGSISDNRLGGWYSYRASKAALNMILKTAALEVGRRRSDAIVVGLHPGTVDTALSQPFQRRVRHRIFSPKEAAEYLLTVITGLQSGDSGGVFAWDGEEIPP